MADFLAKQQEIVSSFLLGSQLADSISMDELRSFFPQKYRGSVVVKALHTVIQAQRETTRREVQDNIRIHFSSTFTDQVQSAPNMSGLDIEDAVAMLSSYEAYLSRKFEQVEQRCHELEQQLSQRGKALSMVSLEPLTSLHPDTKKAKRVRDRLLSLAMDAS
eukprot:m.112557 g.112557  ORF g.112557 m.112557 type:complete len:162 (+) comp13482_c1_seq1:135-620(+)